MLASTDEEVEQRQHERLAPPPPPLKFNAHRFPTLDSGGQAAAEGRQEFIYVTGVTGKVVFLGDPRCGKTSLVSAISRRNVQLSDRVCIEDGCPIEVTFTTMVPAQYLRVPTPQQQQQQARQSSPPSIVVLDICDLSRKFSMSSVSTEYQALREQRGQGTGKVHAALKSYLEDVLVAVIVVDLTRKETLDSVHKWVTLLASYRQERDRKPVACWLVGNKRDRWFARQLTESDALRVAARWQTQYMETRFDSLDDIDALCVNLVRTVFHLAVYSYELRYCIGTSTCPADCEERRLHRHVFREYQTGSTVQLLEPTTPTTTTVPSLHIAGQSFPEWTRVPFSPYAASGGDEMSRFLAEPTALPPPAPPPPPLLLVPPQLERPGGANVLLPPGPPPKLPNVQRIGAPVANEQSSLLVWGPTVTSGAASWLMRIWAGTIGQLFCAGVGGSSSSRSTSTSLEED